MPYIKEFIICSLITSLICIHGIFISFSSDMYTISISIMASYMLGIIITYSATHFITYNPYVYIATAND